MTAKRRKLFYRNFLYGLLFALYRAGFHNLPKVRFSKWYTTCLMQLGVAGLEAERILGTIDFLIAPVAQEKG